MNEYNPKKLKLIVYITHTHIQYILFEKFIREYLSEHFEQDDAIDWILPSPARVFLDVDFHSVWIENDLSNRMLTGMIRSCYVHNVTSYKVLLKEGPTYETVAAVWAFNFTHSYNVCYEVGNVYFIWNREFSLVNREVLSKTWRNFYLQTNILC